MSLSDQWRKHPEQIQEKLLRQIIAFAGDGRLREANQTSKEFRDFLRQVPSTMLARYGEECLAESFPECGFALQDIVNEVGRRLGLVVSNGRYRGTKGEIGNDGLWKLPDGRRIVVEVKTTDAYRINLDRIAAYAKGLSSPSGTNAPYSTLIIVGRSDTGDLEAQIRGSRHAWEVRLISLDSLLRLMRLKEELEDPNTLAKIHEILVPHEFTKLDRIVDLVFTAAEEAKLVDKTEAEPAEEEASKEKKFTPVAFNDACADRISKLLGKPLVKQSRAKFSSPDNKVVLVCLVSRQHKEGKPHHYWFAFHPHQRDALSQAEEGFVALGCGSPDTIFLVPFDRFKEWLPGMNITQLEDRMYWHIQVLESDTGFTLVRRKGQSKVDLAKFLLY
ncbi:MAG: hypothetical protein ACREBC_25790 [Pyrinomonadaceae bacterium]